MPTSSFYSYGRCVFFRPKWLGVRILVKLLNWFEFISFHFFVGPMWRLLFCDEHLDVNKTHKIQNIWLFSFVVHICRYIYSIAEDFVTSHAFCVVGEPIWPCRNCPSASGYSRREICYSDKWYRTINSHTIFILVRVVIFGNFLFDLEPCESPTKFWSFDQKQ